MRTIHGQVIATSAVDRHRHPIPVDKLHLLFDQMPDPWIMYDNHDPAKPPTGRSYNKQFVQLDNGDWVICCDVDIYDEVAFERYGGFSIAFTVSRFTINSNREPEIEVTINSRLIPVEEFHDLARQSTDELQLDVCDLFQKSLDVPAIIFLIFASGAIASGFFGALGTDLYGLLKKKIKEWGNRIREQHGTELQCNITFTIQHHGNDVSVLVAVRSADLDLLEERGVTAETIIDNINQVAASRDLQKVVMRVIDSKPAVLIEYYTDTDGIVHKPALPEPKSGA